MSKQNVNWVFTINNPTEDDNPQRWDGVRYLVYQKEKGKEGTQHYQGYVVFEKKKSLGGVKYVS